MSGWRNICRRMCRLDRHTMRARVRGRITARRQVESQLGMMGFLAVVLPEPAPDFSRGYPHDRIDGGVVRRVSCEDVDTEGPLFQRLRRVSQGMFDDPLEEQPAALARTKKWTFDDTLQLSLNLSRRERSWRLLSLESALKALCGVRHGFRAAKCIAASLSQVSSPQNNRIPYRKELLCTFRAVSMPLIFKH
jgi:hypothetical protein